MRDPSDDGANDVGSAHRQQSAEEDGRERVPTADADEKAEGEGQEGEDGGDTLGHGKSAECYR